MLTAVTRPIKHLRHRRDHRVMLTISVLITGTHEDGRRFSEESHTVTVNSHGALILLAEKVRPGQKLKIRHVLSGDVCECTVVDLGPSRDSKREVGIELAHSSSQFWHVAFPPDDWSPRSPEAKHFIVKRPAVHILE